MARRSVGTLIAAVPMLALLTACQGAPEPAEPAPVADGVCLEYSASGLEMVVPYSAGGGFDIWARAIAPELGPELPDSPAVPVFNRTGAGGLVGTMELLTGQSSAQIIVINEPGGLATAQIGGVADGSFDELRAIARLTVEPEVLVVRDGSEYESIDDLKRAAAEERVLMATNGLAAVQVIAADELGIPFTAVDHEGSSESLASLVRGDTDFSIWPLSSVAQWIRDGEVRPLLLIGSPDADNPYYNLIDGVLTLDDAVGIPGLGAALEQHRMLLVAPDTAQCVIDLLSDAVTAVFAKESFVSRLTQANLTIAHLEAEQAQAIYDNTFSSLREYADLLAEIAE